MDDEVREKLRVAGRIAREAKELGVSLCRDGTSLLDIAERIEVHMRSRGAPPAFPTCISLDHVAAHYSPLHDDRLPPQRGGGGELRTKADLEPHGPHDRAVQAPRGEVHPERRGHGGRRDRGGRHPRDRAVLPERGGGGWGRGDRDNL